MMLYNFPFLSVFLNMQNGLSSADALHVFFGWISIFLRIGFVAFTGYLIYSIVWSLRFLKTNRSKKLKIKLGVLSVVLCVCILLGYTEPPAKIRVKMDTVSDTFNYVKQNKDIYSKDKNFSTSDMFGWISYWDAETSERLLEGLRMTEEEKAASMNVYPTYVFYGEMDGIEVYYEEAKCRRWATLGHFPVDLLGVPDDVDYGISTTVYLISNNECVAVNVNYSGFNPCFFLQFLNSPYFFYSPEIDFADIISNLQ